MYALNLLSRLDMVEKWQVGTLIEECKFLQDDQPDIHESWNEQVRLQSWEVIGTAMYLIVGTRLELAITIGKLAQFRKSPKWLHYIYTKRVQWYMSGTHDGEIC